MTSQDRNNAWGYALFADDLRMEIANKQSLIGMYQGDMLFPNNVTFPILLSKFVVLILYYEAAGSIEHDFSFKISYGSEENVIADAPISRKDLTAASIVSAPVIDDPSEGAERIFHIRMPVILSPFTIPGPGRLRVRVHYSDGKTLKLGSLSMAQISSDDFEKMANPAK